LDVLVAENHAITLSFTFSPQAAKAAAKAKQGTGTTSKRSASTGSLPPKAQVLSHIKAYGRLKPTEAK
jgi:hypothetical protein